jgi:outer membrane protein OmpA-like peptidoglycan-associated protein/flagellar hook assembly protein FlgD
VDLAGRTVSVWTWENEVRSFEWDGRDNAGNVAADGKYRYHLVSKDSAGNGFSYISPVFEIETEKKAVRLTVSDRAFSPNGDSVKDVQIIRAEIVSPEKVKEYVLQIVAQDGPAALSAVRTWKGETPRSVYEWKGETDAQIQAPDGHYAASMKVVYRNGDEAESATGTFLLDRQYPRIEVQVQGSIFSPDGDGRSDTILIAQKSLPGDDWKGMIKDSKGNVLRSWNWQNEAKDLVWDGCDASGSTVPNGIYAYTVESEDVAGNRTVVGPFQIQVETGRRTVQLRLSDNAISPNGDGIKDELVINVDADARDRIKQYNLAVRSKEGAIMKSWAGSADLSREYRWNGTNDAGTAVPDGDYSVSLEVLYLNDAFAKAGPIAVLVDRIAPQATVSLSRSIFSPNGDGRADTVELTQSSVYGDRWSGQIISETGKIVRTWEWYPMLADVIWDGKDQSGKIVSDGAYYYELRSIDEAGNSFILPRQQIIVDATQKNASFKVEPIAFSPNDDGVKDLIYLNVNAPKPDTLLSYSLSIFAGSKTTGGQAPVRSWKGKTDIKSQYVWDGMTDAGLKVPDGYYSAYLALEYANGDIFNFEPIQILVDTVPPKISISADPLLFSPNGDGIKDTVTITQESEPGDDWSGRIRSASGATVRSYSWKGQAKSFTWDGTDLNGKLVPNGAYSYEVVSVDVAGNSASASIKGITVDATKPRVFVTASDNGISPNDDGIRDEVSFSLTVENREGVESWRFSLIDSKGVERSFFGGSDSDVPTRLVWDGRDLHGQVIEDTFTGKLVVKYLKGDIADATSNKIVVKIAPPQVEIKVRPDYFSPDDDGVDDILTFQIVADKNAGITEWKLEVLETAIVESATLQESKPTRSFMLWSGKGMPPLQITWNGKSPKGELVESATDYQFEFSCWDALGNQTKIKGIIAVDVLVIRDGDRLKIRVPSIVFRANHADFIGLDSEIVARNEKVVARIAQILGKFPDYRIRVEGHGNNVGKMLGYSASRIQQEEVNELIPLSTERAEVVRKMLVENGVDPRRLTVVGLGSSEPVVPFTDVQNRWKNRRVEFVLIKNQ